MSRSSTEDTRRVLIVSSHPIFAQALARLVREAGFTVLANVTDLQQALHLLHPDEPINIIVDYEDVQPREDDWLPLLQAGTVRRVILLTLTNNEMIVHEQRRVNHVTAAELKRALDGSRPLCSDALSDE